MDIYDWASKFLPADELENFYKADINNKKLFDSYQDQGLIDYKINYTKVFSKFLNTYIDVNREVIIIKKDNLTDKDIPCDAQWLVYQEMYKNYKNNNIDQNSII